MRSHCTFQYYGDNRREDRRFVVCVKCGRSWWSKSPPEATHAICQGPLGLGDVVHWILSITGIVRLWGKCCRCAKRMHRLNALPIRFPRPRNLWRRVVIRWAGLANMMP